MTVQPPHPGQKYTAVEIDAMRREYPAHRMPGYVLRYDADGMASFVPWRSATGGGAKDPNEPPLPARGYALTWEEEDYPFHVDPIHKRTPQERIDSLAARIAEDTKAGRVLGPEDIEKATVNSWKRGQPVSGEAVRAVAAVALAKSEKLAKPQDQGRTPNVDRP